MDRSRVLVLILLAVVWLAVGCTRSGMLKEYLSTGQPIDVKTGEQFIITLETNPSTGYAWEAGFDQKFLKLIRSEIKRDQSKAPLPGSWEKHQFVFEGLAPGDIKIQMKYRRPWEPQTADAKILDFTVKINKKGFLFW